MKKVLSIVGLLSILSMTGGSMAASSGYIVHSGGNYIVHQGGAVSRTTVRYVNRPSSSIQGTARHSYDSSRQPNQDFENNIHSTTTCDYRVGYFGGSPNPTSCH